jgi:cytochrome c-type biogenesis protein CcmF
MAAGTASARPPAVRPSADPPSSPVARISASAASTAASITAPAFLVSCSAPAFACLLISASRELPLGYTLAALWSGQEGSLLLWLLVLTGVSDAALLLNRRLVVDVLPWTVPILAGIGAYFAFIPNAVASRSPPRRRRERLGMNASLQNPYMMIHPPLQPGYVGLTVAFAFAMAALVSRRAS